MRTFRREERNYIRYQGELDRYQGEYLPHWEVADGIYFVTFRLADSVPKERLVRLRDRYHAQMTALRRSSEVSPHELARIGFEFFLENFDEDLDRARGDCWLRDERVAGIVADALEYFDGEKYHLFAWCIMPNHVHVAFRKLNGYRLSQIVHSWKSYTSNVVGGVIDCDTEHFWQADYYDRLVRTAREFENVCEYILRNPANAGLDDWDWVGLGSFRGPVR